MLERWLVARMPVRVIVEVLLWSWILLITMATPWLELSVGALDVLMLMLWESMLKFLTSLTG